MTKNKYFIIQNKKMLTNGKKLFKRTKIKIINEQLNNIITY